MGDVFDRWRLNCGWNPWDDQTQKAAIASFVFSLDREDVPAAAYSELYERVIELRSSALQNGKEIPRFGVELMLACWPSLRSELREREIKAGRTLTVTAPTNCQRCFGTGMEQVFDGKGKYLGTRPGSVCMHEYVDAGDPTADGFEDAVRAIPRDQDGEETATGICRRVQFELTYLYATAIDQETSDAAWKAIRTWSHAERYCRENDWPQEIGDGSAM